MPNWWRIKCELCGYSAGQYCFKWKLLAQLDAIYHSITKHPFGYCVISAIDSEGD